MSEIKEVEAKLNLLKKSPSKEMKVELVLSERPLEVLDELSLATGLNPARIFCHALALLKWELDVRKEGHRIVEVSKNGEVKELEMPDFLEDIL